MAVTESKREIRFKKLKDQVSENGGILSFYMRDLRDAYGVSKLGDNVNRNITRELRAVGLAHANELTKDQWDCVRLYQKGHPAEDLINALHSYDDESDQILVDACQSRNSSELRIAFAKVADIVNGINLDD
jgi:hypothetical protein